MSPSFLHCLLFFTLFVLSRFGAAEETTKEPSKSSSVDGRHHLAFRDVRYCEILSSRNAQSWWDLHKFTAYNTLLSGCPEEKWKTITTKTVSDIDGGLIVLLNGPRYWLFDTVSTNSTLVDRRVTMMNGLEMVVVGLPEVSWMEMLTKIIFNNVNFYKERMVRRSTIYIFYADRPIFFLESPEKKAYVMQSYSVQFFPQTIKSLESLGSSLKLPDGWSYHSVVLEKELPLRAIDDVGIIVNDNMYNTYSQVDRSLLYECIGARELNGMTNQGKQEL
eukprot:c9563_g1_i1.p1 GENE.c9563_g1_i1~~c9563_g1_i1.p1  ORF type:complete len:290 (-),score=60.41 c9563_g1_i1:187-1014(-)